MAEENKKKTSKKETSSSKKTKEPQKKRRDVKKDISQVEKSMDKAMKQVAKKISPNAKLKAQELLGKADEVAKTVDDIVDHVDDMADNFLPHGTGSTATFDVEWSSKVSRLFIFRFLWMIIESFVIGLRGVWISLLTIVHVLYMFVFGKRERNLWNRQVRYWNHVAKWKAYINGLSDERPDIITPEKK